MKAIRFISILIGAIALILCTGEWTDSRGIWISLCSIGVLVLSAKLFEWADRRIEESEKSVK